MLNKQKKYMKFNKSRPNALVKLLKYDFKIAYTAYI